MYYNKIENTYYMDSEDALLVLGKSVYNQMVRSGDLVRKKIEEIPIPKAPKEPKEPKAKKEKRKTVKSLFAPDKIRTSNKRVMCIETGEVFDSIKEVSVKYGCHGSNISACCKGKQKTAYGYRWRYAE